MQLKCRFGEPHAGWLPVELTCDDLRLEFEVSHIPTNPIDSLILGLDRAISGLEAEIWFNLEPASYYLEFNPLAEQRYEFRIEFSQKDAQHRQYRTAVLEISGNKDEIVLPFWRAITEFASHSYTEPAWPEVDDFALSKLRKRVRGA